MPPLLNRLFLIINAVIFTATFTSCGKKEAVNVAEQAETVNISLKSSGSNWMTNLTSDVKTLSVPSEDGEFTVSVSKVEFINNTEEVSFIEGTTQNGEGKFLVARKGNGYAGFLFSTDGSLSYEYSEEQDAFVPTALSNVMCASEDVANPHQVSIGMNTGAIKEASVDSAQHSDATVDAASDVSALSSLEGASSVIFLNFEGGDKYYIGWGQVNAPPSGLSNGEIYDIWKRVSDDFSMFNINITTDKDLYMATPVENRVCCIISPSEDVLGKSGGLAYTGSFAWSVDSPCWVKPYSGHDGAQLISHEVGHTLGLSHDGNAASSYYSGHDVNGTSWGPIMGAAFGKDVNHWSKGEYANATNQEDDIAIILSNNGVSLCADTTGNTMEAATTLTENMECVEGMIVSESDLDVFKLQLNAGQIKINACNAFIGANLDLELCLLDVNGNTLLQDNEANTFDSSLTFTVTSGVYYLTVKGAGNGDVEAGYTSYSSTGAYALTGSFLNFITESLVTTEQTEVNETVTNSLSVDAGVQYDTDGDGYSDSYEALVGFDPMDANSNINIQVSYEAGDFCCVTFNGAAGYSYTVLASNDMQQWDALETLSAQQDGEELHYKQQFNGASALFYKVVPAI